MSLQSQNKIYVLGVLFTLLITFNKHFDNLNKNRKYQYES